MTGTRFTPKRSPTRAVWASVEKKPHRLLAAHAALGTRGRAVVWWWVATRGGAPKLRVEMIGVGPMRQTCKAGHRPSASVLRTLQLARHRSLID